MNINQTYETVGLDALRVHPRNPNQGDVGAILTSIEDNGWFGAVVAQRSTGYILAGNHRFQAAKLDGADEIPVIWLDVDDRKATKILLADNRLAELATRDQEALATLLTELAHDDDLSGTGYDGDDLDTLLEELGSALSLSDVPDDIDRPNKMEQAAELAEKWGVEEGQVWNITSADGSRVHRIVCGSSMDADVLERLIGGEAVDLVFSDPPYGIDVVAVSSTVGGGGALRFGGTVGASAPVGGRSGSIGAGSIVHSSLYAPVAGDGDTEAARLFYEAMAPRGCEFILWGGNYFTDFLPASRGWIVWDKENTGNFADVELAWCSRDASARLYRWLWNGLARKGDRTTEGVTRMHPTQKPVGLHVEILEAWSREGAVVVDGFLGSGTTMLACELAGRTCYGVELSTSYVGVILDRMSDLGCKPELEQ